MAFGKFQGKSMVPGGGGRFAKMKTGLVASGKPPSAAGAIAAAAGRSKYGKDEFQKMAAAGKARAAAKK